jgi:hypothetical protein
MTNASCFTGAMREMAPGAGGGLAQCARFAAGPWHPRLTRRQRGNGPMARGILMRSGGSRANQGQWRPSAPESPATRL